MRKLIALTLLPLPVLAFAQSAPEQIDFANNATVNVSLSNVDTNRIFVDGDKIAGMYCSQSLCVAHNDKSGSAYLSISKQVPAFTAYATTTQGRHFALFIRSSGIPAKTLELIPQGGGAVKKSQKGADYQDRLATLIGAMAQNEIIDGFGITPIKQSKSVTVNHQYKVKLLSIYQGSELQGLTYQISNITDKPINLDNNTFYSHGIRAIALSKKVLWAHESGLLWEIR